MLKVSMDGKKLGLDQRLINPMLPDDPGSKVNACIGNVMRIYREGSEQKLTQLIFSDMSTPKNGQEKEFSVYDDIREKLLAQGVPESEIAFIHNADTEAKKEGAVCESAHGSGANFTWQYGKNGGRNQCSGPPDCFA